MADLVEIGFTASTTGIDTANTKLNKLAVTGGKVDKSITNATKSINLLGVAVSAVGVSVLTQDLIENSDTWKSLNTQLKLVVDTESELITTRTKSIALAKETNSDLEGTISLFAELTRNSESLNISQERVFGVTKTLNQLFLAGGKAVSETSGAIRQLNQGLAAGALRGDEFNSVAEGAPKILDALASSLGKTKGELRDFAATGGITSEILIKALEEYAGEAEKMAAKVEKTFGQSMVNAKTSAIEYVGSLDNVNGAISALGEGIEGAADNLGSLASGLTAAATVVAVGLTPAIVAYTSSLIASAAAQLTAGTTAVRVSNAYGMVTTTAASATVATNALAIASKLLLGPWGLLIAAVTIGATVFMSAKDEASLLNGELDAQKKIIDGLTTSYSKYSKSRLGDLSIKSQLRLGEIEKRNFEIEKERIALRAKSGDRGVAMLVMGGLSRLNSEQEGLTAESKKLKAVLTAVGNVFDNNIPKLTETKNIVSAIKTEFTGLNPAIGDIASRLGMQRLELTMTTDAYEIMALKMKLISEGAAPQLISALVNIAKENQGIRNSATDAEEGASAMEELTSQVENYGGAWSRTGSVIIDTFGSMADSLTDYTKQMSELGSMESDINKAREKEGADIVALDKLQAKVSEDKYNAELSAIGNVVGAASAMFDEKTAAAKALGAVEKAIAVAQIATSLQKILMGTTEATAVVATEGVKQVAYGTTAILAAAAVPVIGFTTMAAMTALVIGLGVAISGSGGSSAQPKPAADIQAAQGTGSVLGDSEAKSESLVNGMDLLGDIGIDQLSELMSINESMTGLGADLVSLNTAANIEISRAWAAEATNLLFQSDGKVTTSYAGATDTTSYNNDVVSSSRAVLSNAKSAISGAAESLGVDLASAINDYVIPAFNVNIEDLDAEGVQSEISAVFSGVIDEMSTTLLPALVSFQVSGEGLFETITRLSVEQVSFNDHLSVMGRDLSSLSSVMQIDVAQSIIELTGGFEEFAESNQSLIEGFFTDSQQLDMLGESLTDVFSNLGLSLTTSKSDFLSLMQTFDLTTESGQSMYAALLKVNPSLSDYIDGLDDLASDKLGLQIELLNAQGEAELALAMSRERELSAMDNSLKSLKLKIWKEEDANVATKNAAEAAAEAAATFSALGESYSAMQIGLLNAQGKGDEALALTRASQLGALDESLKAIQLQIWVEEDRAKAISTTTTALESSKSSMQSLIDTISGAAGIAPTTANLSNALQSAETGDFSGAQGLNYSSLSSIGSSGFSTSSEQIVAQAINDAMIGKINSLAQDSVTEFDRQITALESVQTSTAETNTILDEMSDNLSKANTVLAKNTMETAKILTRIEQDGIYTLEG